MKFLLTLIYLCLASADGCKVNHLFHHCFRCDDHNSNHKSKNCPNPKFCKVRGCPYNHKSHTCRNCGDSNSDHRSHDCPHVVALMLQNMQVQQAQQVQQVQQAQQAQQANPRCRSNTAYTIIVYDDKVLLGQRASGMKIAPNVLGIPGGGLDPGEKPVEGAIRETFEEAGVYLPQMVYPEVRGLRQHVFVVTLGSLPAYQQSTTPSEIGHAIGDHTTNYHELIPIDDILTGSYKGHQVWEFATKCVRKAREQKLL